MMISRLQSEYTGRVAEIWLEGNLNAHCFIPAQYWRDNFELVKELLGQAEVYVYEDDRSKLWEMCAGWSASKSS